MQLIECEKLKVGMSEEYKFKRLCPFIQKPQDDCYCASLNSQKVEAAIYYCSENFEKCEIYRRQIKIQGSGR